jgi:LPXTG-motif cell wall-anchored protein
MVSEPKLERIIQMKSHPLINSRTALAAACGTALAVALLTFGAKADEWNKKTTLTVNEPIQVRDTFLPPGQYVFKLYNSSSDRHIVQIFNADESHIINTVLAIPKERMEPTGHSQFTFYETPSGYAKAMRAWFYPGDTIGQEFPYPKHLHEVAMLETKSTQATATETTTQQQTAQVEQTPQPQTATESKETTEVAQSTPPPPAAEQTPAPAAATPDHEANREQPAELPKTASPYPLMGLSGLILLGISGLLRLKRWA